MCFLNDSQLMDPIADKYNFGINNLYMRANKDGQLKVVGHNIKGFHGNIEDLIVREPSSSSHSSSRTSKYGSSWIFKRHIKPENTPNVKWFWAGGMWCMQVSYRT